VFAALTFLVSVWFSLIEGLWIAIGVIFGALSASVVALFTNPRGPGNLFPIAIAFMGGLLVVGSVVGWMLSHPRAVMRGVPKG